MCVGIIRRGSNYHVSTCTETGGMALFKYLSRDTSITKPSSSLPTPKEKEVVDDFVKKAEMQGHSAGYSEYTAGATAAVSKYTAENGPTKAC